MEVAPRFSQIVHPTDFPSASAAADRHALKLVQANKSDLTVSCYALAHEVLYASTDALAEAPRG